MDEKVLNEAVENISLIKGVIDRTSKSFNGFSKIFIYWGLLFILNSAITIAMVQNKETVLNWVMRYPFISYVFPVGIIAIAAFIIYEVVSRKIPLMGFEKKLMKVWLLALLINVIPAKISIHTPPGFTMKNVEVSVSNFSIIMFSMAIALIVTSLFTNYKQLSYIGITYIVLSVIHAYFLMPALQGGTIIQLLSWIVIPFTFLYTGFFLRHKQVRGN
jgi:hypothetical protein